LQDDLIVVPDRLNEKRCEDHRTPTPKFFASKKHPPGGFLDKQRFSVKFADNMSKFHREESHLEDKLPACLGWQAASLPSPAKLPDFRCGVERWAPARD
jgi:hypothetical protein